MIINKVDRDLFKTPPDGESTRELLVRLNLLAEQVHETLEQVIKEVEELIENS